jgi:hypothetical protein
VLTPARREAPHYYKSQSGGLTWRNVVSVSSRSVPAAVRTLRGLASALASVRSNSSSLWLSRGVSEMESVDHGAPPLEAEFIGVVVFIMALTALASIVAYVYSERLWELWRGLRKRCGRTGLGGRTVPTHTSHSATPAVVADSRRDGVGVAVEPVTSAGARRVVVDALRAYQDAHAVVMPYHPPASLRPTSSPRVRSLKEPATPPPHQGSLPAPHTVPVSPACTLRCGRSARSTPCTSPSLLAWATADSAACGKRGGADAWWPSR